MEQLEQLVPVGLLAVLVEQDTLVSLDRKANLDQEAQQVLQGHKVVLVTLGPLALLELLGLQVHLVQLDLLGQLVALGKLERLGCLAALDLLA